MDTGDRAGARLPRAVLLWRHQLPALAEAGYRCWRPTSVATAARRARGWRDYDIHAPLGDLVALLDDVGEEQAVFIGHDWGAMVVWQLRAAAPGAGRGRRGPERAASPAEMPPTQALPPGVGRQLLLHPLLPGAGRGRRRTEGDPATTMRRLMGADEHRRALRCECCNRPGRLSTASRAAPAPRLDRLRTSSTTTSTEFTGTGFTGGLNWYRNFDRTGSRPRRRRRDDPVPVAVRRRHRRPDTGSRSPAPVRDVASGSYTEVLVDGPGHWVQQERPAEVNRSNTGVLRG